MDRFKFRVWWKKEKCWVESMMLCNLGFLAMQNGTDIEDDGFNEKDLVIQQSTGLKDRNGKLIYEGDLLRTDLKRPYNIVVFRNGMFMLECEDTNGIYYDLFCGVCDDLKKDIDSCNYEIIGNIYQNKELLEEQK